MYIGVIAQLVEQRTEDPCALVRSQVTPLILKFELMHVYKDIETRDLLKMIPIEDVIEYHGIYNLISEYGIDVTLDRIGEEEILKYIEATGLLDAIKKKLLNQEEI